MSVKIRKGSQWVNVASPAGVSAGSTKVALLKDQKNYDVTGGTFTTGAWRDRDLTVIEDPQSLVDFTVGGSQSAGSPGNTPGYWSVPAGTYKIEWSAPGQAVDNHVCILVWSITKSEISTAGLDGDITTAGDFAEGSSTQCHHDAHSTTFSSGSKVITTTAAATWFKLLHWCGDTQATDGFGTYNGIDSSTKNIYTQVRIEDLATAVKQPSFGVWNVVKTDTQVVDDETWTDISDLSQIVTASASSKFLITATVNCGMSGATHDGLLRLMRGTTVIGSTSSDGSANTNTTGFGQVGGQTGYYNAEPLSITYLDTPGAGTHTYHIEGLNNNDASNLLVNHRGVGGFYTTSQMTIQQIS